MATFCSAAQQNKTLIFTIQVQISGHYFMESKSNIVKALLLFFKDDFILKLRT